MINLEQPMTIVKNSFMTSPIFPYRTGQLKYNFFNKVNYISNRKSEICLMMQKKVSYGKQLEMNRIMTASREYNYVRYRNRHYMYIERIIASDTILAIEKKMGVVLKK